MATLNLLYPTRSDIAFDLITFPDGQPHIRINMESLQKYSSSQTIKITCRLTSGNDLLTVLFAKDVLDREGYKNVELCISYLLAARMDRVMQPGEPFSLKVIADLINAAAFTKIRVFDPHSAATTSLLHRCEAITNHAFVRDAVAHYKHTNPGLDYCLVSPDAGAAKKIYELAAYLGEPKVIECSKVRDPKTGALSHFHTNATDLQKQTCIIVDDICDGGGTFAGTADMLSHKNAGQIILVVSHGIFSKGVTIPGVDVVYSTDSYRHVKDAHCFDVSQYL